MLGEGARSVAHPATSMEATNMIAKEYGALFIVFP